MSWLRPSNSSGSDRRPSGPSKLVVVLDPHHRHALPGGGELVHRGGDGLFALGHGRQGRVPSVWLTTGGRAGVIDCVVYPDRRGTQTARSLRARFARSGVLTRMPIGR